MRTFTVVLGRDGSDAGGYWVSCPAMPGALSQGDSRDETLANIAEAMELWLEVVREDGEDALPETPDLVAREVAEFFDIQREEGWPLLVETAVLQVREPVAA